MKKDYRECWVAGQIQNGKVTYNKVRKYYSNDRALKDFIATVLITLLVIALNL